MTKVHCAEGAAATSPGGLPEAGTPMSTSSSSATSAANVLRMASITGLSIPKTAKKGRPVRASSASDVASTIKPKGRTIGNNNGNDNGNATKIPSGVDEVASLGLGMKRSPSSKSCLKRMDSSSRSRSSRRLMDGADAPRPRNAEFKRSVSFNKIEINQFPIQVGDNPSARGVPITMSWEPQQRDVLDLEEYEEMKPPQEGRSKADFHLPPETRQAILHSGGHSSTEIAEAVRDARKIQRSRIQSIRNQKWDSFNWNLERTSRKIKKVASLQKLRTSLSSNSKSTPNLPSSYQNSPTRQNQLLQSRQQQSQSILNASFSNLGERPTLENHLGSASPFDTSFVPTTSDEPMSMDTEMPVSTPVGADIAPVVDTSMTSN